MKNILITGTSKGIGKYLRNFLKNNFNIYGISRNKSNIENINQINIDLSKYESIDYIFNYYKNNNLLFDYIILNAGVGYFGDFFSATDEEYIHLLNLNLINNILIIKKLEKLINKNGKIIFIGSIIGKKFMKYGAVYQASKFGLRGFAGALKKELKGITIHIINPKIVDTTFHNNSKIELYFDNSKYNSIEEIQEVIKNIILGKEKRFEIDL